jgi:hypothetical protein
MKECPILLEGRLATLRLEAELQGFMAETSGEKIRCECYGRKKEGDDRAPPTRWEGQIQRLSRE